jgi:predicted GNAT family acetyltransferase
MQIVGIGLLLPLFDLERKTIHLEDLVVKDKMRGTGLAALYSEIIKQGKRHKYAV